MASAPVDRSVVPVDLQVELLSKVLRYDRSFAARAGTEVKVLVVHRPESAESLRTARRLMSALEALPRLGGVAHHDELVAFSTEQALAALVKERKIAVVLFTPDLVSREQARAIAVAFASCNCLTVSASSEGVQAGLVLGFDLVSGKPRMLFNLTQSRKQGSDFRAEVLQLMTVFP